MYHEYSANSFSSGLSSYASNHSTMNPTTLSSLPKHLPTDLRPRYRSFANEREEGYLNQVLKSIALEFHGCAFGYMACFLIPG